MPCLIGKDLENTANRVVEPEGEEAWWGGVSRDSEPGCLGCNPGSSIYGPVTFDKSEGIYGGGENVPSSRPGT